MAKKPIEIKVSPTVVTTKPVTEDAGSIAAIQEKVTAAPSPETKSLPRDLILKSRH